MSGLHPRRPEGPAAQGVVRGGGIAGGSHELETPGVSASPPLGWTTQGQEK